MRANFGKFGVVLVATPLVFGACRSEHATVTVQKPGVVSRDPTRALGPGDIRIVSVDSTIELTLVGDSVTTGLAEKALAKVKAATDTGAVSGTGFAAGLERLVKSSLQSALAKEVAFPVASLSDVRFDGGNLEIFDIRGKRIASFGNKSSDSTSHAGKFSATDAQAFIAAFRARKARPVSVH